MKNVNLKNRIYNLINPYILKKNMMYLSPADVFFLQTREGKFAHYDIVLKYAYVQNYFDKTDFESVRLYKKMRKARPGKHSPEEATEIFNTLISNVVNEGYKIEHHTTVNRYFYLLDAAHRNAVAMYLNVPKIKVLYVDSDYPTDYQKEWFIENGFSDDEFDYIEKKFYEISEKYNKPLNVIVNYENDSEIEEHVSILKQYGDIILIDNIQLTHNEIEKCYKAVQIKPLRTAEKKHALIKIKQYRAEYELEDNKNPLPFIKYKKPVFRIKRHYYSGGRALSKMAKNIIIPDNYLQNEELGKILSIK